ncbi:hypothetical protein OSB04_008212 [Centaurea solstitialis]|uniref:Uncharacterized protein n=1 Tax=Centaurea solstitialis TaxID=347529 RepID=A0AA38U4L9_9ASTR|nr:hypothetical protein OSB04_008212 [Centaurea solstitialis]
MSSKFLQLNPSSKLIQIDVNGYISNWKTDVALMWQLVPLSNGKTIVDGLIKKRKVFKYPDSYSSIRVPIRICNSNLNNNLCPMTKVLVIRNYELINKRNFVFLPILEFPIRVQVLKLRVWYSSNQQTLEEVEHESLKIFTTARYQLTQRMNMQNRSANFKSRKR